MKKKTKIWLAVLVLLVLTATVVYGVRKSNADLVTVQTGKVVRQDLEATVTASGEIRPRNYVNISADVMGRLTDILVKEGDHVHRGQLLARLESIQADADVQAQEASLSSSQADAKASEAAVRGAEENLKTAQATVDRGKAELERARLDYERAAQLFKERLISRQEYDQSRAASESADAAVREAEARLAQAAAQRAQAVSSLASTQRRVTQARANLRRFSDVLAKHQRLSPLDGVVTNLPVRVGETVVPGIQNSSASLIMTIADMSLITAEVKVDETDIVNITLGQRASITIDAIPNKTFPGHVVEIGNTAILRSTGLAASQSAVSSQEAKDFKVVIALDTPPAEIRPGLSCSSKITTATRRKALTIPIQALTIRQKGDLESRDSKRVRAAAIADPVREKELKEEVQGVFVAANGKALFRKVDTGITGASDIEVLGGLQEGAEVVTGSSRVIRTLRNEARIKVDNRDEAKSESDSD